MRGIIKGISVGYITNERRHSWLKKKKKTNKKTTTKKKNKKKKKTTTTKIQQHLFTQQWMVSFRVSINTTKCTFFSNPVAQNTMVANSHRPYGRKSVVHFYFSLYITKSNQTVPTINQWAFLFNLKLNMGKKPNGGCSLWKYVTYYSRLSLSRPRLSRITAYLEMKFWSLF